jgi:hypothetical protein
MRIIGTMTLCVMLGGCASVTRGWEETISIASTPSGANAVVSGAEQPTSCVTPCAVKVKRNADLSVSFDMPGYEPQVVPLTKEITATGGVGFAGNLLLGGVIGMGVDAASGAAVDHKPNPVIVTLQPAAAPPPVRPPRRKPSKGTVPST